MNIVDLDKLSELFWDGNYMEIHKDDIPSIPSAFEEMTNGEVFETIYPDHEAEKTGLSVVLRPKGKKGIGDTHILVDLDFWNSPYQKGGENNGSL